VANPAARPPATAILCRTSKVAELFDKLQADGVQYLTVKQLWPCLTPPSASHAPAEPPRAPAGQKTPALAPELGGRDAGSPETGVRPRWWAGVPPVDATAPGDSPTGGPALDAWAGPERRATGWEGKEVGSRHGGDSDDGELVEGEWGPAGEGLSASESEEGWDEGDSEGGSEVGAVSASGSEVESSWEEGCSGGGSEVGDEEEWADVDESDGSSRGGESVTDGDEDGDEFDASRGPEWEAEMQRVAAWESAEMGQSTIDNGDEIIGEGSNS
jgi:hypothetical protein